MKSHLQITLFFISIIAIANLTGCTTSFDSEYFVKPDDQDNLDDLAEQRIQPYEENPWYWQYKGEPVLLLGGSDEDNLFNHPDISQGGLEGHLDEMISIKSDDQSPVNLYVRNTMSSRDKGNLWWFSKDNDTGLYDLNSLNEEYWDNFENFLQMTAERDIIVQIELWDRFDFSQEAWDKNPFNPDNNINYSANEIELPVKIGSHPGENENPFFYSVPELENNKLLLQFQEAVIDKVLEIGLGYEHVLYTISNETSGSPLWGEFWASYIRKLADESGTEIEVTEMWDAWDLTDKEHGHTFNNPELYSFVDISQNGHQDGQVHWDNMQKARDLLKSQPRPMNTIKIYGADNGKHHGTSEEEATNRLWRNILGGIASSRFHRPPHGIGLDETAKTHLRSASMLLNEIDVFNSEPDNALLSERGKNEAYSMTAPDNNYVVYFPNGGSVDLNIPEDGNAYTVRWLNIEESKWNEPDNVDFTSAIQLKAPDSGQWVVLVQVE